MQIFEKAVNNQTYVFLRCNGINIGDRLTDNKLEKDDYRFHDVFQLANAAILGWSPVLRALLRVKRCGAVHRKLLEPISGCNLRG